MLGGHNLFFDVFFSKTSFYGWNPYIKYHISISCGPKKYVSIFFLPTFPSESPSNLRKAPHDDKASTSHCVAGSNKWHRGAPFKTEISKLVGSFRGSWVFGFGFDKKKGGLSWFLQTQRLYLPKSSKISKFILNWKLPIFILHPSSYIPPPPKKKKKLVLIPMLYLVTWVTRTATQPLGSSPSTVKVSFQVSRLPLHREKHRPHYLQVGKPSLRLQSQYPANKTRQPPQHLYQTQVILRENFFEYHLVTLLEGCSHSLDSKCSQHVTYYSKTWYFSTHTILRHPSSEKLSTQTITGVPLVSQASSCCPRHLIRLPTHLGI